MESKFSFEELSDAQFYPLSLYFLAPFTQSRQYGEWQKALGRKVFRLLIKNIAGEIVGFVQLVKYPMAFGKFYMYSPYGPVLKEFSNELFEEIAKKMLEMGKNKNCAFLRLDFTPPLKSKGVFMLPKIFHKSSWYTCHSAYLQPRNEWFLNLEKTEEELKQGIHEKTRYSIRLAERKNVEVQIINISDSKKYFESFYRLMEETATRNGFSLHEKDYYKAVFENSSEFEKSFITVAKNGEDILGINFILIYGQIASHVFGGSATEMRQLNASSLSQWIAIRKAKELGCLWYNFGGVDIDNTNRGWERLTSFKKKFGGLPLEHSDLYDIVINPIWYKLYSLRKLFKHFKLNSQFGKS